MKKAKIAVLVSGGGTNLQALIDAMQNGQIPSGEISVVIASKPGVFALERAAKAGIPAKVVSKKEAGSQEAFEQELLNVLDAFQIDLIVQIFYGPVSKTDHQHPSVADPLVLRSRLLRSAGARGCAFLWCKSDRRDSTLCQ